MEVGLHSYYYFCSVLYSCLFFADSYDYSIEEEQQVFVFGPLSPQRQCRHVDVVSDELMEETEVLRLSLSYTNSSEVVLNISHPHTTVHIQDTSSGKYHSYIFFWAINQCLQLYTLLVPLPLKFVSFLFICCYTRV